MTNISREAIQKGAIEAMAQEAAELGLVRLTTAEERRQSWQQMLADNPNQDQRVWIFAYGSLLWNPAFHFTEKTDAFLQGYHRDFCLRTYIGRGNLQQPGLVLGLEKGHHCYGQALCLAPEHLDSELDILWAREMVTGAYTPMWLPVASESAGTVHAIVFVMDRDYPQYAGELSFEERCRDLALGVGPLGRASDYLMDTVTALESMNIVDDLLERYARRVRALMSD